MIVGWSRLFVSSRALFVSLYCLLVVIGFPGLLVLFDCLWGVMICFLIDCRLGLDWIGGCCLGG